MISPLHYLRNFFPDFYPPSHNFSFSLGNNPNETSWNPQKIFFIAGIFFTFIIFLPHVTALSGNDMILYSPNFTEDDISKDHTEFSTSFSLDNNSVIWMNLWSERKIENPIQKSVVYLLNCSSNQTDVLSQAPDNNHKNLFYSGMAVSGNYVVLTESVRNDIFLFNITDYREYVLTNDGVGNNFETMRSNHNPAVDGDRVVWVKKKPFGSTYDGDIVMLNLSTGIQSEICTQNADQNDPSISGSKIVWTDKRNEPLGGDIFLYDYITNQETPVCVDTGSQKYPIIVKDNIVWRDYRTDHPTVYLHSLSSGKTSQISDDFFDAGEPLLSDTLVVWEEYSVIDRRDERARKIVVYSLTMGSREVLPVLSSQPKLLGLYHNRILYAGLDNYSLANGYVHEYTIDLPMETANPEKTVSSSTEKWPIRLENRSRPPTTQSSPISWIIFPLIAGSFFICSKCRSRMR